MFQKHEKNPLVSPSPDGWDKSSCCKPSALYDAAADVWRIWYNGRNGNSEYIGLRSRRAISDRTILNKEGVYAA